ncbi:MAG: transposase [Acidobacteria bacterium]|nr:MAG: transposase [Acidobacteriota bacterium]
MSWCRLGANRWTSEENFFTVHDQRRWGVSLPWSIFLSGNHDKWLSSRQRALKKAGRAGRRPRLRADDLRRIERGLTRGPQALGYETSLWTSWRVAHLIEEECGVRYHASQAWRILRRLGWSCQRPAGRALERDEEKIRLWKQKRWPEIKKKPGKKAVPSSSSTKVD